MKKNLATEILNSNLTNSKDYDRFLDDNLDAMHIDSFTVLLRKLCNEKNVEISEVIKKSCIDQSYGYQLFNGRRSPSRDKIIQIAIALELDIPTTNKLLKTKEKQTLYVKNKKDSIIMFGLINNLEFYEINDLLEEKYEEMFKL